MMNEVIIPLLPAQIDREVPEEFYAFVFKKFSMLRSKDLARALDRAHARADEKNEEGEAGMVRAAGGWPRP